MDGKFFYVKNEKFSLLLYGYLIEKQKWVSNKVICDPVSTDGLLWHNHSLNCAISQKLKTVLQRLIENKNTIEIVPVSPRNPTYLTEKKFTNQRVFLKWKITPKPVLG